MKKFKMKKEMKQYALGRDGVRLLWTWVEENKWEEQLWQTDKEYNHIYCAHVVKYLSTKMVEEFINRLKEIGFVEISPTFLK